MGADDNDSVGRGRPPKKNRFKKNQSGNPRGRPPKSPLERAIDRVANHRVTVSEHGGSRSVGGFEASFLQVLRQAVQGDLRAFRELRTTLGQSRERTESSGQTDQALTAQDREVLNTILERIARIDRETTDGDT